MLTLREVIDYLELEQSEIEKLVRSKKLDAYKIGGTYLRFKKEQVVGLKARIKQGERRLQAFLPRARDFWYFNRVYILSAVLLGLIVYLLMR